MSDIIEIEPSGANSGAPGAWKQRDAVTNGQGSEAVAQRTLDELAAEIRGEAHRGNERLLRAAELLRELKRRIEDGEAGVDVKWTEWALDKFSHEKTWIKNLNMIANSEYPEEMVEYPSQEER